MKAADRIKKAHIAIMRHKTWCAYSGIIACGKVEVTEDTATACTDGWDVKYCEGFVDGLDDAELRFVVLHEATHKSYRHTVMWKKLWDENPRLTNVAADLFVNGALLDTDNGENFIQMPKLGIKPDTKYRGWSVKQIYDDLKQQAKDGGGGGAGGDGEGFDEHDWENGTTGDAKEDMARENEIGRAIRQGEALRKRRAAEGAGNQDGLFGGLLNGKVDWRKVMEEWLMNLTSGTEESSWRRPSRRYLADDIYLPSMQGVAMGELVIGFDTSGSCFGTDTMTQFVAEISRLVEMIKPEKIHVVYWDTRIAGHQVFEDGQFAVQNLKVRGGGGTDGAVLFDYLRENRINPVAVVQFSDGEVGDWGRSDWPTLWALNTRLSALYGTTIHLD